MKIKFALAVAGFVAAATFSSAVGATTVLSGTMTADNTFLAYLGTSADSLGTLVGSGQSWPTSFSLTPTDLTPGVTNYLNIEAANQGGPGGLSFVLNLSNTGFEFANGTQTITTDPANLAYFTASYNNTDSSGTEQPWIAATGAASQDTGYSWGNVVGTPNWIDDAAGDLNSCGYCTVDFTVAITPVGGAVPEPASWALMLAGFGMVGFAMRRRVRVTHSFG